MPVRPENITEAMRMASECHMALMEIVVARYSKRTANTGDEGGFATPIVDVRKAREVFHESVRAAGYRECSTVPGRYGPVVWGTDPPEAVDAR